MTHNDSVNNVKIIDDFVIKYNEFKSEVSKVIVGQNKVVDQVLLSIFCNGHCLLVGVPGLAKTLLVKTISSLLGLSFNRIQFTPDLMPSDLIGQKFLIMKENLSLLRGHYLLI